MSELAVDYFDVVINKADRVVNFRAHRIDSDTEPKNDLEQFFCDQYREQIAFISDLPKRLDAQRELPDLFSNSLPKLF